MISWFNQSYTDLPFLHKRDMNTAAGQSWTTEFARGEKKRLSSTYSARQLVILPLPPIYQRHKFPHWTFVSTFLVLMKVSSFSMQFSLIMLLKNSRSYYINKSSLKITWIFTNKLAWHIATSSLLFSNTSLHKGNDIWSFLTKMCITAGPFYFFTWFSQILSTETNSSAVCMHT